VFLCSLIDNPAVVMPATPQINYFESRQGYYTQYRRRQRLLAKGPKDEPDGPTYRAAVKKFSEIIHVADADQAGDENLVITVVDRYAVHLHNQGRERTLEILRRCCDSAVQDFGHLKYKDLKVLHIQEWLDKMGLERGRSRGNRLRKWGHTMKRLAVEKLQAAFSWGVQQGMITRNIIDGPAKQALGIRRKGASRGRDYVLQSGEHGKLVGVAKPYFAELLEFLHGTGCRPGEAYHATAKNYDRGKAAIVNRHDAEPPDYVHKTARRTGKDRVIYLTDELRAMVERLCAKNPTGSLFRNRDGRPWTNSSVYLMLKRLRMKLKLTDGKMIAYSYRHTFATDWLLDGGSIKVLADLMGNSVAMIEKHYGHLEVDPGRMRQLLTAFSASKRSSEETRPVATAVREGEKTDSRTVDAAGASPSA
jgi:integrase